MPRLLFLFSVHGIVLVAVVQLQEFTTRKQDLVAVKTVPSGKETELCVEFPDGLAKVSGANTITYTTHRISADVYAKKHSEKTWGGPCSARPDNSMSCPKASGSVFIGTTFEIETASAHTRTGCWSFVNKSRETVDAKLVVHVTVRGAMTFVTGQRDANDRSPLLTSINGSCVCRTDASSLVVYTTDRGPYKGFYAKRGDVIEVKPLGLGNQLGLPSPCPKELISGSYHLKITHIFPFEQPAAYGMIIKGTITSEPLTDKIALLNQH